MKCKILSGLVALLLLSGCLADEYYKDPISSKIDATPGVIVPIAKADIGIHGILSDITNMVQFSKDAQGQSQVTIFQRKDSIMKFSFKDLYSFTPASVTIPVPFTLLPLIPLHVDSLVLSDSIPIAIPNSSLLEAKAKLGYRIETTNFPYAMVLTITLKDIKNPTQAVIIKKDLPIGNTIISDTLFNADIFLKNNKFPIKISLSKKNTSSSSTNMGSLKFTASITNLIYGKGTLQEITVTIPEQSYGINMGIFRQDAGVILYDNPSLNLTSINSLPFGAQINPVLVGENSATLASAQLTTPASSTVQINKRISNLTASYDTTTLDNSNSNIKNFLNIVPNELKYKGKITMNPLSNQVKSIVEMEQNQGIYLGYEIAFPLHVTVNALTSTDTIKFGGGGTDFLAKIEKARITIQSINGFPFEARSILSLRDSNNLELDTLHLQLLKAAPVDINGYVIKSALETNVERKDLDATMLVSLKKTTTFILTTTIYTTNYGAKKVVVIQEDNRLKMQLGLGAQLNTSF